MPVYLLIDNGSKQALATLALRRLAAELSEALGHTIHPVSLQHADAIPAAELAGSTAQTFRAFLQQQLQQGQESFVGLPLFFGESRALSAFIPGELAGLRSDYPRLAFRLAEVTYPLPQGDSRMARILYEHIEAARGQAGPDARVVLVDHGSPSPQITAVRQGIARELRQRHGLVLDEACMERREGAEYDFNGELLEQWLRRQAEAGHYQVIIAMLFFLPGRHAGPCGDVEEICQRVVQEQPQLRYTITPLVSEHPLLLEILKQRLNALGRDD